MAAAHANKPQARRLARGGAAVRVVVGVRDNDEDLAAVVGMLQEEERRQNSCLARGCTWPFDREYDFICSLGCRPTCKRI